MAKIKRKSQAGGTQTQPSSQQRKGPLPDAEKFAFLQAIMQDKWMSDVQAKTIFDKLVNSSRKASSYLDTVADINAGLSFLLMELRTVHFPIDSSKYIGLVNKEADDVAKTYGSSYTIPQIQYLRALIERIAVDSGARDGVGSISSLEASNTDFSSEFMTQATQSQAEPKRLGMTDKDTALKMFIRDGWLISNPDRRAHYSLGVRTFLDLYDLLLEFDVPPSTREVWERML